MTAAGPSTHPRNRRWQAWLQFALGIGLLGLALREGFRPDALKAALAEVDVRWLCAAIALIVLGAAGKAARWALLVPPPASEIRLTWGPLLTGQALNLLAWGRIGDVARIWLFSSQAGAPVAVVVTTLLAEHILELAALTSLTVLLVLMLPGFFPAGLSIPIAVSVAAAALIALVIAVYYGETIAAAAGQWLTHRRIPGGGRAAGWLRSAASGLVVFRQGGRQWPVVLLTAGIWSAAWLTNQFLFKAFALPLPAAAGLLVLVMIYLGVAPGLMPTNVGPFYFLTMFALQQYGVAPSVALAYAATLHALVILIPVIGALLYLLNLWRQSGKVPTLIPP